MMLGLAIRLVNGIKKKDCLDIVTLAIPQILFMLATFVYMDFLIIYKWSTIYDDSSRAPSIIATMIQAYAGFGTEGERLVFWSN